MEKILCFTFVFNGYQQFMTRQLNILIVLFFTMNFSLQPSILKTDSAKIFSDLNEIKATLTDIESKIKTEEKTHFEKYGALYVGFIALFGALYAAHRQFKNTKGQAVANFRMKWLEDYRKLCSDLQVSLDNIAFKAMEGNLKDVKKTFYVEDKDFIIARTAYHRLRLMVDTTKKENIKYLELVSDYMSKHIRYYSYEKNAPTIEELSELKKQFLEQSEKKLTNAWTKASQLK